MAPTRCSSPPGPSRSARASRPTLPPGSGRPAPCGTHAFGPVGGWARVGTSQVQYELSDCPKRHDRLPTRSTTSPGTRGAFLRLLVAGLGVAKAEILAK